MAGVGLKSYFCSGFTLPLVYSTFPSSLLLDSSSILTQRLGLIHTPSTWTSSLNDFLQRSLSCTCLQWASSGILLVSHSGFISSSWNSLLCSLVYINLNNFVLSAYFSTLLFIPFPISLNMSGEQIVEKIIHEYSFTVKSKSHFHSIRDQPLFTSCKQLSAKDLLV